MLRHICFELSANDHLHPADGNKSYELVIQPGKPFGDLVCITVLVFAFPQACDKFQCGEFGRTNNRIFLAYA